MNTIKSYGETVGYEECQVEKELRKSAKDPTNPKEQERKDAIMGLKSSMLAYMYISRVGKQRCGDLKMELVNDDGKGASKYG